MSDFNVVVLCVYSVKPRRLTAAEQAEAKLRYKVQKGRQVYVQL